MGTVGFFFPGQGAQRPGMGKSLYDTSPAARAVFDRAEALRPGTAAQCFYGDMETLSQTANTQPCLFTAEYACAAALAEAGVQAECCLGFSLGELAAVAFCGILEFDEAFLLVNERARRMEACARRYPGAMAAVLRLPAERVELLCVEFGHVYPANYNCPGQTVVSGLQEAFPAFEEAVRAAGGRVMRLAVSGSFHSPFMEEAAEGLAAYMEGLAFQAPRIPLYANATARLYSAGNAAALLAMQVKKPVLFQKSVENMQRDGCSVCIETGPGGALGGLVQKIGGMESIRRVEDAQSLLETAAYCKEAGVCPGIC